MSADTEALRALREFAALPPETLSPEDRAKQQHYRRALDELDATE